MIDQARLLTLNAAHRMDTVGNKVAAADIAMIKVVAPNMSCKVVDWAIQAHGGGGVSQDFWLAEAYAHQRTVRLVHAAGGWTSLAHPAYYRRAGFDALPRLLELRAAGLDALEADYPYHACSPHEFSHEDERDYNMTLAMAAGQHGLRVTRGSDCHTAGDFMKVYGR